MKDGLQMKFKVKRSTFCIFMSQYNNVTVSNEVSIGDNYFYKELSTEDLPQTNYSS